MRKLKLQVQISVDGYIAGPEGEMDWMTWNWDDALKNYVDDITAPVDCIVMGRNLAAGFIPYWGKVAANKEDPQFEFGKKMTDVPKVVFTKTLEKPEWDNTVLAKGNLADEIKNLKQHKGKDIIVYGGATFVSSLIKENLIDEYHLFINPAILGSGMPIFNNLEEKLGLQLKHSISFECGIAVLCYMPGKN